MNLLPKPPVDGRTRPARSFARPLVSAATALAGLSCAGLLLSTGLVACANDEADSSPNGDAAVLSDAGSDAANDAGCDPSQEDCNVEVVPCESVAWCMVTANVSVYNTLASVWGTGPSDVWAAGSGGAILHYDGTQWTPTPTGRQNTLFGIWGSGPNDVWAVSSTDVLLHSAGFVGGTATWELAPSAIEAPIPAVVRAIWGSSPDSIRLGGRTFDLATSESGKGSQFVRAADGSWTALPGTFEVTSIWGAAADDVWMTADNGVVLPYQRALILHGTNGGGAGTGDDPLTWTPVESQANLVMDSIWGTSSSDVWTVGGLGTIRHFGNGDIRFQEVASPTRQDLHAVWGTGPDDVWAVGDAGTIIHWNGQAFDVSTAQFPIGRKPTLRGIWGSGRDDVWVVGDGIVLHYTGTKSGVTGGDK